MPGPVFLVRLAFLLAGLAALFALHLLALGLADGALIPVWLLLAGVIGFGLLGQACARRRMFLAAHVVPGSSLQRILRGGALMVLMNALKGLAFAALLILFVVRQEQTLGWQLLLLHLPVAVLLTIALRRLLYGHLADLFLPIAVWRLGLIGNMVLLLPAFALAALHGTYPDFADLPLVAAISVEIQRQAAESALLLPGLQLVAAVDAVAWWLAQQWLPVAGLPLLQLAGWLLLFGVNGLFLWSYLLYLAGLVSIATRLLGEE